MWAGEAAMRKSIPAIRQAGYESISNLPRIQQNCRDKALVVNPPAMRICAMSNGEQRVQVLIPVMQGLSQKQQQLMQHYFELVYWQGLKLPSAERRQQDSLKSFERSVEVWKDWTRLKKELATLVEELPPAKLLPAIHKKQIPDPTKKDASKEKFGRRALAGATCGICCHVCWHSWNFLTKTIQRWGWTVWQACDRCIKRRCSITRST